MHLFIYMYSSPLVALQSLYCVSEPSKLPISCIAAPQGDPLYSPPHFMYPWIHWTLCDWIESRFASCDVFFVPASYSLAAKSALCVQNGKCLIIANVASEEHGRTRPWSVPVCCPVTYWTVKTTAFSTVMSQSSTNPGLRSPWCLGNLYQSLEFRKHVL